ncbi:farnesyl diphosphate synthase [Spirochaetota bacterium]|nr:farnesyl diphosphate synthase [Spirochaetota bacterium]
MTASSDLTAFNEKYNEKKVLIEQELKALVLRWEQENTTTPTILRTIKIMKYSLLLASKRIRPVLTLFCYDMLKPIIAKQLAENALKYESPNTLPTAALLEKNVLMLALSIEFIHTYSLVHDDLPAMDNASLRRNHPTAHIVFSEADAILAGDSLLTAAFKIIADVMIELKLGHFNTAGVLALISSAAGFEGMIAGQVYDLEAETRSISSQEIKDLHLLKTGKIIEAALLVPAVLCNLSAFIPLLKTYANSIGLAFQIIDDILDTTQVSQTLGKPAKADLTNKKTTYLTFMSVAEAYDHSASLIARAQKALDDVSTLASKTFPNTHPPILIDPSPLKGLARYIHERKQ